MVTRIYLNARRLTSHVPDDRTCFVEFLFQAFVGPLSGLLFILKALYVFLVTAKLNRK